MSASTYGDLSHLLNTPTMRRAALRRPSDHLFALFDGTAYGAGRRLRTEGQRATAYQQRRKRGGDGRLPYNMRAQYTEGQRAVLSVIGEEVAKSGQCSYPVEKLAALAGVGVRTVQYAISRAKTLGHLAITYRPQRGRRSLSNIVRVAAADWMTWLKPKLKKPKDIGCKAVHTEENSYSLEGKKQSSNEPKYRNGLMRGSDCQHRAPKDHNCSELADRTRGNEGGSCGEPPFDRTDPTLEGTQ